MKNNNKLLWIHLKSTEIDIWNWNNKFERIADYLWIRAFFFTSYTSTSIKKYLFFYVHIILFILLISAFENSRSREVKKPWSGKVWSHKILYSNTFFYVASINEINGLCSILKVIIHIFFIVWLTDGKSSCQLKAILFAAETLTAHEMRHFYSC